MAIRLSMQLTKSILALACVGFSYSLQAREINVDPADYAHMSQAMDALMEEGKQAAENLYQPISAEDIQGCLNGLELPNIGVLFTSLYGEYSVNVGLEQLGGQIRDEILNRICTAVQDEWNEAMASIQNATLQSLEPFNKIPGVWVGYGEPPEPETIIEKINLDGVSAEFKLEMRYDTSVDLNTGETERDRSSKSRSIINMKELIDSAMDFHENN